MTRSLTLVGLLVVTLSLVAPVDLTAKERPFKLRGDGMLLFNPQETPSGPFAASGQATHLGRWHNLGHISFEPMSETELAASGEVTFEAANGDLLDMDFEGVLDVTTGQASGIFIITGGTGRFDAASGVLNLELDQAPDGAFSFTLNGTIDY